jgi:ATP-dependent DNA ligase
VVEEQELEGPVAKPLSGIYKPSERGWLKVKNKAYWKYELEREAIFERRTSRRRASSQSRDLSGVTA